MGRLWFLFLLLSLAFAAPPLPADQGVISLIVEERDGQLYVEAMPVLYDVKLLPTGDTVTEEVPLNVPISVTIYKGSEAVGGCSITPNEPFVIGGRTFYKGSCTLNVGEGCYRVEANATAFYNGRELPLTSVKAVCVGESESYVEPLITALKLDNPAFFLQPQCFFFFFFLLLAVLALSYRGIAFHKVFDLTYPRMPVKVFSFKYGYTIYHMGKEIGEYDSKLTDLVKNPERFFGRYASHPLVAAVKSIVEHPRIEARLRMLGVNDFYMNLAKDHLKAILLAKALVHGGVTPHELERILESLARASEAHDKKGVLLKAGHGAFQELLRKRRMLDKESKEWEMATELSILLTATTNSISREAMFGNPKPKVEMFQKLPLAYQIREGLKLLLPHQQGTAITFPLKQAFAEHMGEGLIAVGRQLRETLPGFKAFTRKAYEANLFGVRDALQKALKKGEPGTFDKLLLAAYGLTKDYKALHDVSLERGEGTAKAAFEEVKLEMGKVVALEHLKAMLEKSAGVPLEELSQDLSTVEPERFHEYMERFHHLLMDVMEKERRGELSQELGELYHFMESLEKAQSEEEILKILNDWKEHVSSIGGDSTFLDRAYSVAEEAFTAAKEYDNYLGKVFALSEAMEGRQEVFDSLGGKGQALQKFLVDLLGELSFRARAGGSPFLLSEALLASHILLMERNFGLGEKEKVAGLFAHYLRDRASKAISKEEAERLAASVGESLEKAYDRFYKTVEEYINRRAGRDLVGEIAKKGDKEKSKEEVVVEFLRGGQTFGEIAKEAHLKGLEAFYIHSYTPTFDVDAMTTSVKVEKVELAKGIPKEWTDLYQSYAPAASNVLTGIEDAFGGTTIQPFSYIFASRLSSTFSELTAYANRAGIFSPDGRGRLERIGLMFPHYLALAAYVKAYEEMGLWLDRTVQKPVKDEEALIRKAKEILMRESPEELISYLDAIEWKVPVEIFRRVPFLLEPEGAVPTFLSTEGFGKGRLPFIANREALARLWKVKEGKGDIESYISNKELEIVTRNFKERDRAALSDAIYHVDEYGRFHLLPVMPLDAASAHTLWEAIKENASRIGLSQDELKKLEMLIKAAYADPATQQSLFDRLTQLQKEFEKASPQRREEIRREMEALSRAYPMTFHSLPLPLNEAIALLRKVEEAFHRGEIAGEGFMGLRQRLSYKDFANLIASLSVAYNRNLLTVMNHVSVGRQPSLERQLRFSWQQLSINSWKDWWRVVPFSIEAFQNYFRYSLERYYMGLFASTTYPNLEVYVRGTKYRTMVAHMLEQLLGSGVLDDYEKMLAKEAKAKLGYVPAPTLLGGLWDVFGLRYFKADALYYRALLSELKRYKNFAEEVMVMSTWAVPRNEFLMAYHISPDVPHVGMATGYHMGPLVGYSKWYSHFIYNYFPTNKFLGGLTYRARGWNTLFTASYPAAAAEYLYRSKGFVEEMWGEVRGPLSALISAFPGGKDLSKKLAKADIPLISKLAKEFTKEGEKKPMVGGSFSLFRDRLLAPAFYYGFLSTFTPGLLPAVLGRSIYGMVQPYLIHFSLAMGAHVARARRAFSAAFHYPSYEDILEEYDEKLLEKTIERMLRRSAQDLLAKPSRERVEDFLTNLSYLPLQQRLALLQQFQNSNLTVGKENLYDYLISRAQQRKLIGKDAIPPQRPFPWLSARRPATASQAYYTPPSMGRAYGLMVGELLKGAFPLYLGLMAPFTAFTGLGLYSYFRYRSEKGGGAFAGLKPSHWGIGSATFPLHIYEGIKLPPYHFRWYIPGIAGFFEKTIGHGYLHGLSWELIPEPWVTTTFYAPQGFGFSPYPIRPQYHGTSLLDIATRQQLYLSFYTPAENYSYAFLHPLFALSYISNRVLNPWKARALKERTARRHYSALSLWGPYTSWKDKGKAIVDNPLTRTALSVGAASVALSNPIAFTALAGAGLSKATKGIGEATVMGYCPKCGARKPKGEPCPRCGFKPFSPDF